MILDTNWNADYAMKMFGYWNLRDTGLMMSVRMSARMRTCLLVIQKGPFMNFK